MLYPMFMLVLLTNVVLILSARTRFASVKEGKVPANYYALMTGSDVPEFVAKTSRHLNNLFEVPVLFYAAGATYLAMDMAGSFTIWCAWTFVAARFIHTCIHLSYNNIMHRFLIFGLGTLSVLGMWLGILAEARV
ncbi:MAG: MAPEG family protein [Pseudohongiellaceae bacterium]